MVTYLDLPDHVFETILDNLNQKQKLVFILINKEMYNIGIKKLYRYIYVNFEKPLLIDTEFCTFFNCKYTIINDKVIFPRLYHLRLDLLQNIKLVMFSDYSIDYYGGGLKRRCNLIKLGVESLYLLDRPESVDIIEDFSFPTSLEAQKITNYNIRKLTFDLRCETSSDELWRRESAKYNFENCPDLEAVRILNITQGNLESFLSNLDYTFDVKRLSLETDSFQLGDLFKVFNLNSITCFELKTEGIGEKEDDEEEDDDEDEEEEEEESIDLSDLSDFKRLFNNLTNLKHLNLITEPRVIRYLLDFVKLNSLISLAIGPYSRSELSIIPQLLSTQMKSLVNFSTGNTWDGFSILEEFGQICNPTVGFSIPIPGSEAVVIESMKNEITKYPRLSHIVCSSGWRGESGYSIRTCCHFQVI